MKLELMDFAAGSNFHIFLGQAVSVSFQFLEQNFIFYGWIWLKFRYKNLILINSQKRDLDVVFPNLLYAEIDEDAVPAVDWVIFYESSGATRPVDGSISSELLPFQTVINGQTGLEFMN